MTLCAFDSLSIPLFCFFRIPSRATKQRAAARIGMPTGHGVGRICSTKDRSVSLLSRDPDDNGTSHTYRCRSAPSDYSFRDKHIIVTSSPPPPATRLITLPFMYERGHGLTMGALLLPRSTHISLSCPTMLLCSYSRSHTTQYLSLRISLSESRSLGLFL